MTGTTEGTKTATTERKVYEGRGCKKYNRQMTSYIWGVLQSSEQVDKAMEGLTL